MAPSLVYRGLIRVMLSLAFLSLIESTPNKLSHTEDTSNRYTNSKSQFKQPKINNSTVSKLENYVDQKFDEAAMKHLKENIMSDVKY